MMINCPDSFEDLRSLTLGFKEKEIHQYGEYCTRRLVLEEWEGLRGTKEDDHNGGDLKG